MAYVDDVTFFRFFTQTKHLPHRSINHAQFSKSAKFHENPFQKHGNMGPQTYQVLQRRVRQGAST